MTPAESELTSRIKARHLLEGFAEYIKAEADPVDHQRLICRALDPIARGEKRNVMIFCPPGAAKSTYGNTLFSAYYLGKNPQHRVVSCSYSYDLAKSFGRKARNLVNSRRYRNVFNLGLAGDTRAVGEWEVSASDGSDTADNYGFETSHRGGYIGAGVGSGLTGRRGNLGLIDDPVKDSIDADSERIQATTWDWYTSVFLTRLLPDSSIVIIQTRWHENDLAGKILPKDWDGESGTVTGRDGRMWDVICLPAVIETPKQAQHDPLGRNMGEVLWPEYYTPDHWAEMRQTFFANPVTTRHWYALCQQVPKPPDGTYFKREWFTFYEPDGIPANLNTYLTSDFAVTGKATNPNADFTEVYVSGMDSEGGVYLAIDGFYGQLESDVWVEQTLDLTEKHRPDAEGHEGGVIRRAVEPYFKRRRRERRINSRVEWINPIGNKQAGCKAFQMLAASGRTRLPNNEMGHRLLRHLLDFPNSTMDHGPDAMGKLGQLLELLAVARVPQPERTLSRRSDYGMRRTETRDPMAL